MKDRCKLYCRVAGTTNFYQLKDRVADGTPCGTETNDICVQGLCRVSKLIIFKVTFRMLFFFFNQIWLLLLQNTFLWMPIQRPLVIITLSIGASWGDFVARWFSVIKISLLILFCLWYSKSRCGMRLASWKDRKYWDTRVIKSFCSLKCDFLWRLFSPSVLEGMISSLPPSFHPCVFLGTFNKHLLSP